MTLSQKMKPDGNCNGIITSFSNLAKVKLQYMKNVFHVAHLHINMVFSTINIFKDAKVPKSRGALGTGFTYAPILLFELYVSNRR